MSDDNNLRPWRRYKRTTTERSPMIPTERLCDRSTAAKDAAALDEVIKSRPLHPPVRRRRNG